MALKLGHFRRGSISISAKKSNIKLNSCYEMIFGTS